jgi:hypothetical protein
VLGIREYSLQHKARFQAVEEEWVEDWISGHKEGDILVHPRNGSKTDPTYSLFALPAEENFSGRLYPLRQIREIQVPCPFSRSLLFRGRRAGEANQPHARHSLNTGAVGGVVEEKWAPRF